MKSSARNKHQERFSFGDGTTFFLEYYSAVFADSIVNEAFS